ncbi:MAG: hypothetical protein AAGC91_12825 [Pseudomonadota bacterium]
MSFQIAATATSIAGFILAGVWMLAGQKLLQNWGVVAHDDGLIVGRRMGVVYFGNAVMLLLSRTAPASELRDAICIGMLLSMSGLASLGIYEFRARRAGAQIFGGVVIELAFALAFAAVLLSD